MLITFSLVLLYALCAVRRILPTSVLLDVREWPALSVIFHVGAL